jgi:ubiquinone/menaquinone biosynthesis C-methylase UbiE
VGCGVGNDLTRFAKGQAHVVGIDLAQHSIDLAETNFAQRGLTGDFAVMNGEAMRFDDDTFDAVYCHTVLHFTPNPAAMIQEIHRVLKPGGQAIVMTVNRYSWLNLMHRLAKIEIDHLDAPIFYQYTHNQFRRLLQPFAEIQIVAERFPVPTQVHEGWKDKVYNDRFVGLFNRLPRRWVTRSGHHLLAFATKSA